MRRSMDPVSLTSLSSASSQRIFLCWFFLRLREAQQQELLLSLKEQFSSLTAEENGPQFSRSHRKRDARRWQSMDHQYESRLSFEHLHPQLGLIQNRVWQHAKGEAVMLLWKPHNWPYLISRRISKVYLVTWQNSCIVTRSNERSSSKCHTCCRSI